MVTASPAVSFENLFTDIELVMYILCKHPVSLWPFNTSVSDSRVTFRSVIYLCAVSWWLPHNVTMDTLVANRIYRYVGFLKTHVSIFEWRSKWLNKARRSIWSAFQKRWLKLVKLSLPISLCVSPSFHLQSQYYYFFIFFRFDIPCGKAVRTFLLCPSSQYVRPVITVNAVSFFIPKTELWERVGLWWSLAWKAAVDTFLTLLILRDSLW